MTKETDNMACRYTAQLVAEEDHYVIQVPDAEVEFGPLTENGAYRVTIEHLAESESGTGNGSQEIGGQSQGSGVQAPVTEGDQLDVTIEDLGQQGDGIARVGPGYVLIIPGSSVGDNLTVEVQEVNPSFGFAEIVSRDGQAASVDSSSQTESQLSDQTSTDEAQSTADSSDETRQTEDGSDTNAPTASPSDN